MPYSTSHIISGRIGHLADGTQVTGTGQGSGTTVITVNDTSDSGGGTIRTITAIDISDTTAIASDVAQGKYFYTANGIKTAGTASGGGSGTPAHTIYFEYLDGTNTTISVDYSDSIVGTMITSYKPTTHNNKYVGLAQLDGVTWYSPAAILPNTELIDYSTVTNDTRLNDDGTTQPDQWYGVSDYTMIDPTMTFNYKGLYWGRICFYDETQTFITYLSIYNDGEQQQDDTNVGIGTLTPAKMPATAKFIRISTLNDADSSILSLIRTA